jgi:hypothetical protein
MYLKNTIECHAKPKNFYAKHIEAVLCLIKAHPDKTEVRVYDYRDSNITMLASMAEKRRLGYRAIGYEEATTLLL